MGGGLSALAFAAAARAEQRFPPPDFESGYEMPRTYTPAADASWVPMLDVIVLAVFLAVASWLILRRRSRIGVLVMTVAAVAYFGFWRKGCVCPIGAIQNVSYAIFDGGYALPLVVGAFFFLPLVFTMFFGRTFCAAVCPLGAIQDLVAVKPLQVPLVIEHPLRLLRWVYLGAAVLFAAMGSAFIICEYDPFIAIFRLGGAMHMFLLGAAFLAVGMFVVRPYCRYLCPLGAILGLLGHGAKWHARVAPEPCIQCRLCEDACPVNAIRMPAAAVPQSRRPAQRRRLGVAIVAAPILIAAAAAGGWGLSDVLARMDRQVGLAERIHAEDAGDVAGSTDASAAWRATGEPKVELYATALAIRGRYEIGAVIFGAFVGFVFAAKLVQLASHTPREEYEIDPGWCVSCARCFRACPHDPHNLELLQRIEAQLAANQDEKREAVTA